MIMPQVDKVSGIGLALLVASVVSYFSVLGPMRQDIADLRTEVAASEAHARKPGGTPVSLSAQAAAFLNRLPTREQLPAVLSAVVAQAEAAGLRLERGDYEFTMAKSGVVARYRLSLPVAGTYVQIQKFVEGTLASLPPVALEGLKLERDNIGDAQLQASLQFSVMVRSE
jgi:hypothetical protein